MLPASLWAWKGEEEGQWSVTRIYAMDNRGASSAVGVASLPDGDLFLAAGQLLRYRPPLGILEPIPGAANGFSAVALGGNRRVWAGGQGDFGYLEYGASGAYAFVSLRAQLPKDAKGRPSEFGTVLAIQDFGERGAVFVTTKELLYWDGASLRVTPLGSSVAPVVLHPRPDLVWLYLSGRGLYSLLPSGLAPLQPESAFPGPLRWLLPPPGGELASGLGEGWLVGTENGAFVRNGERWAELGGLSEALRNARPTAALLLPDGCFAVATRTKGVLLSDFSGNVFSSINAYPSLEDSQVLSLQLDSSGDLWVGTTVGLSRVASPLRSSSLLRMDGTVASPVRDVAFLGDKTYVATSRGVCVVQTRADSEGRARLAPLPPTPGPVWTLAAFGGRLLAGGVGGLWEWSGSAWSALKPSAGDVVCTLVARKHPGRLYYSNGSRLLALGEDGGEALSEIELKGSPTHLVEDGAGDLWIATSSGSLLWLRLSAQGKVRLESFGAGEGLPPGLKRLQPVVLGSRRLVFADTGILEFDEASGAFVPVAAFSGFRGVAAGPADKDGKALWLLEGLSASYSSFLAEVSFSAEGKWQLKPLGSDPLAAYGVRMDQLFPRPDGEAVWASSANARSLFRFGPEALRPLPPPQTPRLVSAAIQLPSQGSRDASSSVGRSVFPGLVSQNLPLSGGPVRLPSDTQRIRFEFSAPGGGERLAQTQLGGLESEWVSTSVPVREYTGLAAGRYEFRVRLTDQAGRYGAVAVYPFVKEAVWYLRWPAWLAYFSLAALAALGVLRWRLRNLKRQNESLNRKVDERTRELALANSAKMEFLASVSHEIRNPLNGVVGLVGLLNQAHLAPRERELTRSLAACARSLRRVFDDVLGFARLEDGKVVLSKQSWDLRQLLEEVAAVFAAEAELRGVKIEVRTDASLPSFLCDGEKIRTVVSNFVANALKYAHGSPIEIEASSEPLSENVRSVGIQVRDYGPGIPLEEQELIFRKFVRGSEAERLREPGAGLGLATCQALARVMGGGVGVESSPGKGATFFLQLELAPAPTEAEPASAASSSKKPLAEAAPRALVVEDQEYNQLVTKSILERLGYGVTVASNGETARRAIAEGGFSVILVDWYVPGAKGDELARLIRKTSDGAAALVLALTAHDSTEIRNRCLEAGMDAFLLKPLDEQVLRNALKKHSLAQEEPASPVVPSDEPDFGIFSYLGRGDEAASRRAATEYLEQLDAELRGIERSASAGEYPGVASRAHRLCAHAAIVHFAPLQQIARRLQEEARTDGNPDLSATLAQLRSASAQLRDRLVRHLEQDKPAP